jgi:gliding motility-associated-like protein
MKGSSITFTILILLFAEFPSLCQTTKLSLDHRRFSTSNSLVEDDQENIIYLNSILPPTIFGEEVKTSNITSLSKQKKVNFSFDYQYPFQTIPSKLINYKDGFIQSSYVKSENRNKHLMRLSSSGEVIWSKTYGAINDSDPTNNGISDVELEDSDLILLAGGAASFASSTKQNDIYLAKIASDGELIWGKQYCFSCNNGQSIFSSITKAKSGTLIVGTVSASTFDEDLLIYKVDIEGEIVWAKKYSKTSSSILSKLKGVEVVEKKNGNLLVIANNEELDENNGCYILELNDAGDLINAIEINLNENGRFTLTANSAYLDQEDNVIISAGAVQDSFPDVSKELNILFSIDQQGDINWKYNYYDEILAGFGTSASKAIPLKSGLIANMTNNAEGFDKLFPILVVTDKNGRNSCELIANITSKKSSSISAENLTIVTINVSGEGELKVTKKRYKPSIESATLEEFRDTIICDNAITIGNIFESVSSYSWSTGENTPKIEVDEPGTYSVVLQNKEKCFLQNDTIIVAKGIACDSTTIDPNSPTDTLIMANVFSPESGNANAFFSIINQNFKPLTFMIYDAWGELVFKGDESNNYAWDGNFNGQRSEQGVYVYLITYQYKNSTNRKIGDITLHR